jgi:NADPH:quinone reductase-like Zn-dependent oxidoreductase
MKAVILNGTNLSLAEKATPSPQAGEVRIRVKAVGFNPVDWKIREQWFGKPQSDILGSDASGVIDAVGTDVSAFAVNDEVYAMTMSCCSNGSYAEYICIPQELLGKKPSKLSFEQAAAIPLASMTAYRMTLADPTIKKGDTVFITGAGGGVGTFAVQFAKIAGAKSIFTLAKNITSQQYLHDHFAIPLENILIYEGLSNTELTKKLLELHEGNPFDVSLDLVGGALKDVCLGVTKNSGTFVTIVDYGATFPAAKCTIKGVFVASELQNADQNQWKIYQDHMRTISEMLEKGSLQPPSIQNLGTLSAETVEKAHTLLKQGRTKGKLTMTIS